VVPGVRVEAVSDALLECGAISVDAAASDSASAAEAPPVDDPGATVTPWRIASLTALFPEANNAVNRTRDALRRSGVDDEIPIREERVEDEDWVRRTQTQFQPIRVSDRLWVVPTWHEPPDPNAKNIVLDPGIAFGTGSHATTRLCLEWLGSRVAGGERVLDYGCGSGILAIAAMKLGAAAAVGVDIDPQAVLAATRNGGQNRVAARFFDPQAEPGGAYDIVVANILADPLKVLAPLLVSRVRSGGELVLAGILESQAEGVAAAYAGVMDLAPVAAREGWVLLAGRRV